MLNFNNSKQFYFMVHDYNKEHYLQEGEDEEHIRLAAEARSGP